MRISFTVDAEVEHRQGKFASREELAQQLQQAIDDANPGDVTGDNEGEYEVTDWTVSQS